MNKHIAIELNQEAYKIAERFSKKDREGNFNNEKFSVLHYVNSVIDAFYIFFCINQTLLT